MNHEFFIGDSFMTQKIALSQTVYSFAGANKRDGSEWEVSVLATVANGYAGGGSTIVWKVGLNEELRVSGRIKGYFVTDGLNRQKLKEHYIKAIKFRGIEKDMITIEFIE